MVSADAVITSFRSPATCVFGDAGVSSGAEGNFDEYACCARRRALVLVAIESDIRRLLIGCTGAFGLAFENASERRSYRLTGRRGYIISFLKGANQTISLSGSSFCSG